MKAVEWAAYHLRAAMRRLNDALQVAVLEDRQKAIELAHDVATVAKLVAHLGGTTPRDFEPLDVASVLVALNELLDWADDVYGDGEEDDEVLARILIIAYNLMQREPSKVTKVVLEKHYISEGGEVPWWMEK